MKIDFETAERITRLTLTEQRDYLQAELDQLYATMDSEQPYWMHPEDVDKNHMMIHRINEILEYFGGELYGECEARESDEEPTVVAAFERLEAYFLEIGKSRTQARD